MLTYIKVLIKIGFFEKTGKSIIILNFIAFKHLHIANNKLYFIDILYY